MRLLFLLLAFPLSAFVIGNPGQPYLMSEGVTFCPHIWSLRVAYLDDYVYSQHFVGEFDIGATVEKPPVTAISSETALVTLNYRQRLDIYGILGSAKMQMDQEVFGRRQFAWGVGAKTILYQDECLQVGVDFKYFTTDQKPLFLVSSGLPLDLASNLQLNYREYQAALGASYRAGIFCPYINGSYINAKINPNQYGFLIHVPGFEEPMDASMRSFISANTWGLAVGATLIMGEKGTLNVESRFINQNGINASLEIRF